ncbi:hypothetical protein U1Q18_002669 [Sarracenia purpurea var. burkii]
MVVVCGCWLKSGLRGHSMSLSSNGIRIEKAKDNVKFDVSSFYMALKGSSEVVSLEKAYGMLGLPPSLLFVGFGLDWVQDYDVGKLLAWWSLERR